MFLDPSEQWQPSLRTHLSREKDLGLFAAGEGLLFRKIQFFRSNWQPEFSPMHSTVKGRYRFSA